MKIFFLIENINKIAGTERITLDLINLLSQNTNWDISLICLKSITTKNLELNSHVKLISLDSSLQNPIKSIKKLHLLIKQEQPNYLINVAVIMSRISIFATLHTPTKVITWEHFNLHAGSKLGYIWRLISASLSHKTVVLTHKDRQSYPKWLQHKVETIYNFTTIDNTIKADTENSNIVISVGRLTYQKGFDMLLYAWEIVHQNNPELILYLIGDGEDKQKLKELSQQLQIDKSIIFISQNNEINKYYQKAGLYVMSSRFEGLPLVLIEAKRMGLPCISFDCPNGPNEIIRKDIDGYLIEQANISALAHQIIKIFNDRKQLCHLGKEAALDAEKRFSENAIINQWITLLAKC